LISPAKGVKVEHVSAQDFLREEFQGHHTSQARYKFGVVSPQYETRKRDCTFLTLVQFAEMHNNSFCDIQLKWE
jgi:hypothetical protein